MMSFLNQLKDDMKSEMSKNRSQIKSEIQSSMAINFQTEMQPVVEKINTMEQKIEKNSTRINQLDREKREHNIIIYNLEGDKQETWEDLQLKVLTLVETKLGITCRNEEFARVKRIGQHTSGRIRPILIKFLRYNMKLVVLKNKTKLKGTQIKIDEDYPPDVQERRRTLWPELKRLREQGHIAHLKYDRIVMKDAMRNTQKRGLSESPEGYTQPSTKRTAMNNNLGNTSEFPPQQSPLSHQQLIHIQQQQHQHQQQQQQLQQPFSSQQMGQLTHTGLQLRPAESGESGTATAVNTDGQNRDSMPMDS